MSMPVRVVEIREGESRVAVRRNELVLGHFRLSVWAQRLFLILVAHVGDDTTGDTVFRFEIADLARWLKVDRSNLYTDLIPAIRELEQTKVSIERIDGKPGWMEVGLIQNKLGFVASSREAELRLRNGAMEFFIHAELLPYVKELSSRFTRTQLEFALRLRSSFSQKLYDVLKAHQYRGPKFTLEMRELRSLLAVGDGEYEKFGDFRRTILEVAAREICQKTDICFGWEAIKGGKKVVGICFSYNAGACNIEFLPETRDDKLLQRLVKAGVTNETSAELVRAYGNDDPQRISWALDEALRKHRKGELKSPTGWIISAIKEDWRPQRPLLRTQRRRDGGKEAQPINSLDLNHVLLGRAAEANHPILHTMHRA